MLIAVHQDAPYGDRTPSHGRPVPCRTDTGGQAEAVRQFRPTAEAPKGRNKSAQGNALGQQGNLRQQP